MFGDGRLGFVMVDLACIQLGVALYGQQWLVWLGLALLLLLWRFSMVYSRENNGL
jgi:hypothetical protein